MASIWDTWTNKENSTVIHTFSIIATEANPLLARIHNTKKRMPVILKQDNEKKWIQNDLEINDIVSMLLPYDEHNMEAFPVSRLISGRRVNTNIPQVIAPYKYQELLIQP
jgi:putative SOS response-associated peptidase YedK